MENLEGEEQLARMAQRLVGEAGFRPKCQPVDGQGPRSVSVSSLLGAVDPCWLRPGNIFMASGRRCMRLALT